jgi:hypothetical protein
MAPQALVVAAASGHKYLQLAPIRLVKGLSFWTERNSGKSMQINIYRYVVIECNYGNTTIQHDTTSYSSSKTIGVQ